MHKYYVEFGGLDYCLLGTDKYDACIKAMDKFLNRKDTIDTIDLPMFFRVSERGHEVHEDDEIYPTECVIKEAQYRNNPDGDF